MFAPTVLQIHAVIPGQLSRKTEGLGGLSCPQPVCPSFWHFIESGPLPQKFFLFVLIYAVPFSNVDFPYLGM